MFRMRLTDDKTITVEKLAEGYMRVGAAQKTPAIVYRSIHDGELTMRPKAEFERLFEPVR